MPLNDDVLSWMCTANYSMWSEDFMISSQHESDIPSLQLSRKTIFLKSCQNATFSEGEKGIWTSQMASRLDQVSDVTIRIVIWDIS